MTEVSDLIEFSYHSSKFLSKLSRLFHAIRSLLDVPMSKFCYKYAYVDKLQDYFGKLAKVN